eukprot:CAMPEP_0170464540 /NCGR_PEP_ID=MMETSP0123-20130129/9225_1 /TAXON_ID=182087 /ORGANISM="Favella ehrenbergii, Strain Fehren 1" /LENGTH=53 /DNA_ID=CAMNT_0010730221 /DNA_START=177 /DNA_END=335 /DNA_ORIENTATION=+
MQRSDRRRPDSERVSLADEENGSKSRVNLPILKLKTWLEQTALPPYSKNSSMW